MKLSDLPKLKKYQNWSRRSKPEDRTVDGIVFASKTEAARYMELMLLRQAGQVLRVHRQPIFDIAGVVYKPDFMVIWADGVITYEEVKGQGAHPEVIRRWRRNEEQVWNLYRVKVDLNQPQVPEGYE